MMAGLEDVEAWLDASDKNGVSVAFAIKSFLILGNFAIKMLSHHREFYQFHVLTIPCQDGSLSYEEFKFAFVGTNMINL